MKTNLKFITVLSLLFLLLFSSSCKRKGESLNNEADVLSFDFRPNSVLLSKPTIQNKQINAQVVDGTDISKLEPVFILSEGATISPVVNGAMDFTNPVEFTISSEDKSFSKTYTVNVLLPYFPSSFAFEEWKANLGGGKKGEHPIEKNGNKEVDFWSSSNPGYGFMFNKAKEDYPVKETVGKTGKGVSLVTREGIAAFGAPIVAGSLFCGSFVMTSNRMKTTHFGQPITKEPIELKGHYAYKAGAEFKDKDGNEQTGKDKGIISAVFFEVDDTFTHLDGTNLYADKHIVSMGQLEVSDTPGSDFHEFTLKLKPVSGANKVDFNTKKYKLALVFSSSAGGGEFLGAVGSELKIDEVELITK